MADRKTIAHISIEVVVIGVISYFFQRKTRLLDDRIFQLEKQVSLFHDDIMLLTQQLQRLQQTIKRKDAQHRSQPRAQPSPPPNPFVTDIGPLFYSFPPPVQTSSVHIKEDNGSDSDSDEEDCVQDKKKERDPQLQHQTKSHSQPQPQPQPQSQSQPQLQPPKASIEDLDKELEEELNELAEIL